MKILEHVAYNLHLHINHFMLEEIFKTHKSASYCKISMQEDVLMKAAEISREASLQQWGWDGNWKKKKNRGAHS